MAPSPPRKLTGVYHKFCAYCFSYVQLSMTCQYFRIFWSIQSWQRCEHLPITFSFFHCLVLCTFWESSIVFIPCLVFRCNVIDKKYETAKLLYDWIFDCIQNISRRKMRFFVFSKMDEYTHEYLTYHISPCNIPTCI